MARLFGFCEGTSRLGGWVPARRRLARRGRGRGRNPRTAASRRGRGRGRGRNPRTAASLRNPPRRVPSPFPSDAPRASSAPPRRDEPKREGAPSKDEPNERRARPTASSTTFLVYYDRLHSSGQGQWALTLNRIGGPPRGNRVSPPRFPARLLSLTARRATRAPRRRVREVSPRTPPTTRPRHSPSRRRPHRVSRPRSRPRRRFRRRPRRFRAPPFLPRGAPRRREEFAVRGVSFATLGRTHERLQRVQQRGDDVSSRLGPRRVGFFPAAGDGRSSLERRRGGEQVRGNFEVADAAGGAPPRERGGARGGGRETRQSHPKTNVVQRCVLRGEPGERAFEVALRRGEGTDPGFAPSPGFGPRRRPTPRPASLVRRQSGVGEDDEVVMGGRERRRRGGTPRDPNLERSYRFLHPRRRRPRRRRPGAFVGAALASQETLGEKRVRQLDANRRHDPGGTETPPRASPAARETRERRERPSTQSRGGVELLETPLESVGLGFGSRGIRVLRRRRGKVPRAPRATRLRAVESY